MTYFQKAQMRLNLEKFDPTGSRTSFEGKVLFKARHHLSVGKKNDTIDSRIYIFGLLISTTYFQKA
jgi:hypothetical protein